MPASSPSSEESRRGTCRFADDPVRILGKLRVRIGSPERISVMPDEMEKLVSELPRDGHGFSKESATNV
jgi:hypothetical protein